MATATWAGSFVITDTKTANYQAINGELIPCDTSGGGFTVTAPVGTNFGISTAFGIQMFDQVNPVTLSFSELAQPPRRGAPQATSFDVVVEGVFYVAFNGTEWLIV